MSHNIAAFLLSIQRVAFDVKKVDLAELEPATFGSWVGWGNFKC